MKVVAGLGNPGRRYRHTRHNAGFEVVDALARSSGCPLRRRLRWQARTARVDAYGEPLLLVQPLTFMNHSGRAVAAVMRFHGLGAADLIVVLDDADRPFGRIRVRPGGGSGGHRGLASVIASVGSDAFARLRVGIGRPTAEADLVAYVLARFTAEEQKCLPEVVDRAAQAVLCMVADGTETAMNRFND